MDLDLVYRFIDSVGFRGGVEESDALSAEAFENGVVVGALGLCLETQYLAADHHVIADVQAGGRLQANIPGRGIALGERGVGFHHRSDGGALDGLAIRIENFEKRIKRRAEPAGIDLENELLASA